MREIIAGKNDAGQRLDKLITKKYNAMPMSMMYKLIRKKRITVNRKRAKESYIINEGDVICIFAPEDVFDEKQKENFRLAKMDFSVAYEDDNIIIADKKAGTLVHSDDSGDINTLVNQIKSYLYSKGEYNPEKENSFAPALCNRIDRNTSGLVIAAKNADALREMNQIVKNRLLEKKYLAAVHGIPKEHSGEIKLFIEKDSDENMVKVSEIRRGSNSKTAITRYKTLSVNKERELSLLEIELVTGRTHQIRASMAHIGHPLLGDGKYAVNKSDRALGYTHQSLCSYSIRFLDCDKDGLFGYLNGVIVKAAKPDFLSLFQSSFLSKSL